METRRLMNDAMPRGLVWAQLGLYTWAVYAIARTGILLSKSELPASALVLSFATGIFRSLAAYGVSNENRWGYWAALAACAATSLPTLDDVVHEPTLLLHPDFLLLLIIPLVVVMCLLNPASRDFAKMWFK